MVSDGLLQDGQGALADFMFLEGAKLGLIQLRLRDVDVLIVKSNKPKARWKEGEGVQTSWWTGNEMRDARPTRTARVPPASAHASHRKVWESAS